MKVTLAAFLLTVPITVGAYAAGSAECDPTVDYSSPAAMIAALMPKSVAQIEACAARGIRYSPQTPAEPTGRPRTTEVHGVAAFDLPILFESGSADLSPAARAVADGLGKALASPNLQAFRFRIEGHTDAVGTADYNRDLSLRRAGSVTRYLIDMGKIDPARLETAGYGFERLVVQSARQTPQPRNRRVQIVNIGGS